MKKTTLKKLLTSFTITTLIIGLVAPTVVSGDEIEEPIVDEVEEINEDYESKAEEVVEEPEEVEEVAEEPANEEVKQDVTVKATSGVAPLSASTLVAETTTLEEAFPDVNFRTWVYETALGHGVGSYVDDTHKTTKMSQSEIDNKITGRTALISVANKGISSLDGIEHFKSVTNLTASGNQLTGSLDVTHMSNLTTLYVQTNQLSSIDVSGLKKLKVMYVHTNELTELKLAENESLTALRANSNQLTSIDVTDAVELTELRIGVNSITSLNVTNNNKLTALDAASNKITGSLDVTHMSELNSINVQTNQLTSVDVSGLKKLKMIYVNTNGLTELKLAENESLTALRANSNQLTSIDVTDAVELTELRIGANRITSLNVTNNNKLITLDAASNKIEGSLDLTHMSELTSMNVQTNQLTSVDVSGLKKLKMLYVNVNKLVELRLSENESLTALRANSNQLVSVDVSDAIELTEFRIQMNELTSLNISNNSKVTVLQISENKLIGSLDVTHMEDLVQLYIQDNQLTDVNVSGLTKLTLLYSHYNSNLNIDLSGINTLTTLSLSKGANADLSKLTTFYVTGTKERDQSMIRVTGNAGVFSVDYAKGYYVIDKEKGAQYAVGVAKYDDEGMFVGIITSSSIDLSQGALMDDEGNLIIGATLDNVNNDGSITLESGTVVTGDGVYEFTGEFTIKDGEITTGADYSYSKNIIEEGGTVVVGGETTTITVPNGSEITIDGNDSTKTVTYPAGSTVTNKDGDTIYVIDDIEMNSDGTISSGSYITVPNGTTIVDNGDGTVTIPKDMVVTLDDEDTVYPGEIIFDTSTGKTEYVPISGLITEDETNGTNLGAGVDEESLSKAEEILDLITDGKLKDQLEEIVNTVKDMLDASKEVNDMYDADGNLKSTVTEEMIQEIEEIVNALPDGTFKDNLKDKVEEAQTTLDQRNEDAQDKVDNLFNEDKTDLGDGVGQKEIDEAQKAVDKLPDSDKKEELQKEIDKVQDMLDEIEQAAKDKVDDLFDKDGNLKEDVTQETIDDVKKEVDNLPDGKVKEELEDKLEEAQNQLNEREAQDKVDNLFNEDKTNLGNGVGQTEIDEAQKAVDKLPNGDKKNELQKEIDKAQDMLDAKDAVNDLFNPDGSIKDGVTQDDINDALDLVNNLPDGSLKDELLNLIKEAQKEVDERTYVVLEGFTVFTGKGNVNARIDAPVENFSKVYVNGKELDKSNYEVTSGSTVITLKESYLLTLENKTHDVEVEFVSGAKVSIPLTVNVKTSASIAPPTNSKPVSSVSSTTGGSNVNTGDSTDLTTLYAIFAISLVGVVVITKRKYVK